MAVLIAAYIEDNPVTPDEAGTGVEALDVLRRFPGGCTCLIVPSLKRTRESAYLFCAWNSSRVFLAITRIGQILSKMQQRERTTLIIGRRSTHDREPSCEIERDGIGVLLVNVDSQRLGRELPRVCKQCLAASTANLVRGNEQRFDRASSKAHESDGAAFVRAKDP